MEFILTCSLLRVDIKCLIGRNFSKFPAAAGPCLHVGIVNDVFLILNGDGMSENFQAWALLA